MNALINKRKIKPHKATISPDFSARNVLTNSIWEFVSLWLKKKNQLDALLFWDQARYFAKASQSLPVQSSPLLHYYSFMNAAKALLVSRGITFSEHHGVRAHNMRPAGSGIDLSNEGITILAKGILPSICDYFQDQEANKIHSLKDIFLNIPWVHRTYCLTYPTTSDLFISLRDCEYSFDTVTSRVHLSAKIGGDFSINDIHTYLPKAFGRIGGNGDIESTDYAQLSSGPEVTTSEINKMIALNLGIRKHLSFINGTHVLWYLKVASPGNVIINRSVIPLTLAAMHRVSELCRYRPRELNEFLSKEENWLLTEFINMASDQYFDEISSEITGHQFLPPNVRAPS